MDEDGNKLRDLEQELFVVFVKNEVEAKQEPWKGSYDNNKLADLRISNIIKTSFKNYEKTKENYEPTYFKFN